MLMTILVKDQDQKELEADINPKLICFTVGNTVHMANGAVFEVKDKVIKEIKDYFNGNSKVANPTASVHVEDLINELHALTGGKGKAKATSDRKARLNTRLKDFTEEELKEAARKLGKDEFMQGDNDNNKRYGTIDYLLRTSANVNKWFEAEEKDNKPRMF